MRHHETQQNSGGDGVCRCRGIGGPEERYLAFDAAVDSADKAKARAAEIRARVRRLLDLPEGEIAPRHVDERGVTQEQGVRVQRLVMETDPAVYVPCLLLSPAARAAPAAKDAGRAAVVWVCSRGKGAVLRGRREPLLQLLAGGISVLIPDVRGVGESASDTDDTFMGDDASLNGYGIRLAKPLIGMRVKDVLCAAAYLRTRPDVDPGRVGVIGDSLSACNLPQLRQLRLIADPGIGELEQAESLGRALALFAFAADERLACAGVRGCSGRTSRSAAIPISSIRSRSSFRTF